MRKNSNNVSEKNRTIGMLAIAAFLVLFASTLGVGWVSLSAVAGTSDIDEMGDTGPEPTGGWGSGWINDTLTEVVGVDCQNSAIATGPGDILHAVFACDVTVGGWNIFYSTSTDGGETWSPQVIVAGSPDDETNPDIAVSPDDGRMFVVYQRNVADEDIWSSWSDDGVNWNLVSVIGFSGDDVNPSVTVEHNIGSSLYYVYMAFEAVVSLDNRNVLVYRSTDRGLSWGQQLNHGGLDANVYSQPDIAYQHGTNGFDYLYVAFREGVDAGDIFSISIIWSMDYAVTWSTPFMIITETDFVRDLSIAGSRDGDKLVIAYVDANAGDSSIKYSYDQDPTTPATGWSTLTRGNTGTNGMVDGAPEVKADGEGTMDITIGGLFHLVWSQGFPDYNVVYSTSLSSGTTFTGMAVTDNGQASQGRPIKGLTTQLRGGTWYPCLTYSEFTGFYDIYYTTPGMRSMVDTSPSGLNVIVDSVAGNGPRFFNWPAGMPHTLDTTSPQGVGPTSRLVWVSWSDALAQSHMITSGAVDVNYTANFAFQYAVTIDTAPAGLNVWVDGIEGPAPQTNWWDDLSNHDLDVTSPQGVSPTRYWWSSWSDVGAQAHTIQVTGAETITANFFTQHEITVEAWDQINMALIPNVPVYVDGLFAGITPYTNWFYEGTSYDIGVEDPYNDGVNDYNFVDWDFGPAVNPAAYIPAAPATIRANYDQAPTSSFSLEIDPLTRTIAPGGATTYTITLTSLSGYAGDVQLGATALPGTLLPPAGTATATFLPSTATVPLGGTVTSTLTIDNTAAVPEDIYTISVRGQDTVSAAISDSNDTELIVVVPTFTMVVTPPLKTIAPGMDAQYDVTVTSVNGYTGVVDLVVAGLPGAATGSFSINPVNVVLPGGVYVSVLTVTDTGALTVGIYPFTVTGDDGTLPQVVDGADLEVSIVPFFSMEATPALRQVSPGGSTTFTVTATSVNNYIGTVDVSVSHGLAVADATLSWSKTTLDVPDGGSDFAVLTVSTTGTIADKDYTLTFYADDGPQNETDDSTLNVSSTLPGSISGTVEDENGDPIENADVELVDDNTQLVGSTTTDSLGFYEFTDVDPGSYTVKASKTGYRDDERSLTLASGDDKTQDLELKFGSIEGVVVDENGDKVTDATVEVIDENGDVVGTDTTNSQGRFEIEDLLLGTYTVRISADGYKTLTVDDVEITNDEPSNDLGDREVTEEVTGNFLTDYWWLLLLIIIIVVVLILVVMLAKRKKPAPEEAPPEYATAQVPAEQAPPYQEAPAEQPPYQEAPPEQYPPQEPQPEQYPEEPQPETPSEETPPETPPEGYPPEE